MNYIRIQFATFRVRKIRFLGSGFISFTGVLVPCTEATWSAPPRFRAAVTGDSYIQGVHNVGAWWTGTGHDGALEDDGDSDLFMSADSCT